MRNDGIVEVLLIIKKMIWICFKYKSIAACLDLKAKQTAKFLNVYIWIKLKIIYR